MKRYSLVSLILMATISMNAADITLPQPQKSGGKPLMETLSERKSARVFDTERQLSHQQLADLLWAACGYNREDKLTIPTALNRQEISIYAITPDGAYRYDAKANVLREVNSSDIRSLSGQQEFAQKATLNIAIVSDKAKMAHDIFAGVAAGAVMQNIYLWCASNGIGTVARGSFDGEALAKALELDADKRILLVQTVGY
ncbi:MAG: SagB/ThcOx family dehydrogenase [Muribaculaceae bacterium]|nr:SagB/ThcOx family dehydrogenase [Muribaculaceae bacterium]